MRLNLTVEAAQELKALVAELKQKGPHIKANPSKIASAIVINFCRNRSTSEFDKLSRQFSDERALLHKLIRDASDGIEAREKLISYMKSKGRPGRRRNSNNKNQ